MKQYQAFVIMGLLAVIAGVMIYTNMKKEESPEADTLPAITPPTE